ncbi:MAG: hypothetical protein WCD76_17415 [Pyrinomonadaceae bacterium]
MKTKKIYTALATIILTFAVALGALAAPVAGRDEKDGGETNARVRVPLNLAILIQDDLVSRVGNELKLTREFINALPQGSRVMVGYLSVGTLRVRQPFTNDLEKAGKSLRVPLGSTAAAPYNPYVEVREALKAFPTDGSNRNVVLLISDGLDVSRGFDFSSSVDSIDLNRAVSEARRRNVAIYSFYAPSVGLTSFNSRAVSFGQSALNRISNETGGTAFFQGTDFVTFNAYFKSFSKAINRQNATAY